MTMQHAPELHQENLQPQEQLQADLGLKTRSPETTSNRTLNFSLRTQVTGGLKRLRGFKNDLKQALGVLLECSLLLIVAHTGAKNHAQRMSRNSYGLLTIVNQPKKQC